MTNETFSTDFAKAKAKGKSWHTPSDFPLWGSEKRKAITHGLDAKGFLLSKTHRS